MPLLWVAYGLVLVLLDLGLYGWDLLPDPVGWVLVVVGLSRLRGALGPAPLVAAAVALAVSVVVYPPWVLQGAPPALAWALSLPQVTAQVLLALGLGEVVPHRRSAARLCGWLLLGVGLTPAVVLGGGLVAPPMVGLVAFLAVALSVWLVGLLAVSAREAASDDVGAHDEGRP